MLLSMLQKTAVYAGCKGTKFLANHNLHEYCDTGFIAVYAGCKGTKFLANHNRAMRKAVP